MYLDDTSRVVANAARRSPQKTPPSCEGKVTLNGLRIPPASCDRRGSRDPTESGSLCLVPSEEASSTLTTGGNLMTHTEGRRKEPSRRRLRWDVPVCGVGGGARNNYNISSNPGNSIEVIFILDF